MRSLAELFKALADPTRLRILRVLEGNDLRVQELVEVLGLAQPTVSRHLGVLLRGGLLRRRRDGVWVFYGLNCDAGPLVENDLGSALRARLRDIPPDPEDLERLERCLEARVRRSREFYARMASEWDGLRAGLEVEGMHLRMLGGVLPGALDLVDAGTGTGALLPILAPAARRLLGVDRSTEMLAEARRRTLAARLGNVALLCADASRLPLADGAVDGVCSLLALHHAARPAGVVAEFVRVLRPGGCVVISDLVEHSEEWMRSELAHQWLGFAAENIVGWSEDAGLVDVDVSHVRRRRVAGERAMPDLFVVRGRKPSVRSSRPPVSGRRAGTRAGSEIEARR
ncbi:MAG: ArsR/SmtB family transcription factor [Candidatus Krumholzibacteriia bacterium]